MATFTPQYLHEILRRLLPAGTSRVSVAYSGGLDSTVLLVAMARIRDELGKQVRAIHIDHQLQQGSAHWAKRCERTAVEIGVPFRHVRVDVNVGSDGVEAGARRARYEALRREMNEEEALLTAHHADDQLETVLLALLRGAGPRGLSASPAVRSFGPGSLVRPLLDFTRTDLERWAREERLTWVADPMNESISYDRNYLRHEIVPRLRTRWPAAALNAVRSAALVHESAQLLETLADIDLRSLAVDGCLDVSGLREMSPPRRRNVLRHWLRSHGVRAPSARRLAAIDHDMLVAQHDRVPAARVEGAVIRRHRNLLYCISTLPQVPDAALSWDVASSLVLPPGLGELRLEPTVGGGIATASLPSTLRVAFRRGGETLKAAGDAHRRSLKKRLQQANILPWWRGRLPIIYAGDRLVAVGDLWVSAQFAAQAGESGLRVVWVDKPAMQPPMERTNERSAQAPRASFGTS
ncbi:MAG: tRNA lysidine(34) synthetase TilS [Xanthomonadaceae bacterium]|nr:tRNA lysidine(34) synthetase TilS [Xanthomonadaceae bacterium]